MVVYVSVEVGNVVFFIFCFQFLVNSFMHDLITFSCVILSFNFLLFFFTKKKTSLVHALTCLLVDFKLMPEKCFGKSVFLDIRQIPAT